MNALYIRETKSDTLLPNPYNGVITLNPFSCKVSPFLIQFECVREFLLLFALFKEGDSNISSQARYMFTHTNPNIPERVANVWNGVASIYGLKNISMESLRNLFYALGTNPEQIVFYPDFKNYQKIVVNCFAITNGVRYYPPQKETTDTIYFMKQNINTKVSLPILADVIMLALDENMTLCTRRSAVLNQVRIAYKNTMRFVVMDNTIIVDSVITTQNLKSFKKDIQKYIDLALQNKKQIVEYYKNQGVLLDEEPKQQTPFEQYRYLFGAAYTKHCMKRRQPKIVATVENPEKAERLQDDTVLPFPKGREPRLYATCDTGFPGIVKKHNVPCCFKTRRKNWDVYFGNKKEETHAQFKIAVTMKPLAVKSLGTLPKDLEVWIERYTSDISPKYRMGITLQNLYRVNPIIRSTTTQFPSVERQHFSQNIKSIKLYRNSFAANIVWARYNANRTEIFNFHDLQDIQFKKFGLFYIILVRDNNTFEIVVNNESKPYAFQNYEKFKGWMQTYLPQNRMVEFKDVGKSCSVDGLGKVSTIDCIKIDPLPAMTLRRERCVDNIGTLSKFHTMLKKSKQMLYEWTTNKPRFNELPENLQDIAKYTYLHQQRFTPPLPPKPIQHKADVYQTVEALLTCLQNVLFTRVFNNVQPNLYSEYIIKSNNEYFRCKNVGLETKIINAKYVPLDGNIKEGTVTVYYHNGVLMGTQILNSY